MLRHPIYLLLCLFAVVYLALASARGWSAFYFVGRTFAGGRAHSPGGFHHK